MSLPWFFQPRRPEFDSPSPNFYYYLKMSVLEVSIFMPSLVRAACNIPASFHTLIQTLFFSSFLIALESSTSQWPT